jgi:chromosome segregation ATPase
MEQITTSAESEEALRTIIAETEHAGEAERARHSVIELAWAGEQQRMLAAAAELQQKNASLVTELASVREELSRENEERLLLKSEVEAQWQHTQKNGEHIEQMTKERDALKGDIEALESKISTMEEERNDSENRKSELEAELHDALDARDALEKERDEVFIPFLYFISSQDHL